MSLTSEKLLAWRKEQQNVIRYDSADCIGTAVAGGDSELAPQPFLGLHAERRGWPGGRGADRVAGDRQYLIPLSLMIRWQTVADMCCRYCRMYVRHGATH